MENNKIKKVLIANRGEIALRIQRACHKLGISCATTVSEVDRNLLFARSAEEAVVIGPAAARDSYLSIDRVLEAAQKTGADAVHPGYGFLSENAQFARRVRDAGLIFIGPRPESIEILGSKTAARAKAEEYGVPCTPGTKAGLDDETLVKEATRIGFPVIIKAVAGGGGRGMRIAHSAKEAREFLPRARAEALKNFASDQVYLERYIERPRHVEVQIFGDSHGTVVHFGTRDCSTQRRHQKLVEEAPAPYLSPAVREGLHQAAVSAAQSVSYENAGTAEFLVKGEEFYFLEMNTRIQVEHPVTEAVTGVDLVELQLLVAQGERIPFRQEEIATRGHAIEFRIYAEDPANNFAPDTGAITSIVRPTAAFIREDFAYEANDSISLHYDAMLSKVIVQGDDRGEAIARSYEALRAYQIRGIKTTLDFHRWLLRVSPFYQAPLDIGYLEREFGEAALRALAASEIPDPAHQAPVAGAERREELTYRSSKFGEEYVIEVIHCSGGDFLARARTADGRQSRLRCQRRSNGRDAVVKSLIADVLETVPPHEVVA